MAVSFGSATSIPFLVPPVGAAAARDPNPGFEAARARTSDLVAQAKQDAERQPLSLTDPVRVSNSVGSAADAIEEKLEEKSAEAGPQLPGQDGAGGRVDIRV